MSLNMLLIAIALISSVFGSSIKTKKTTDCCEEYCYAEDTSRPQYKNLATSCPYAFAKGSDTEIYNVPGCNAEKIWMILRHGTRLPSSQVMAELIDLERLRDEIILLNDDSIVDINSTLPEKGRLCAADLDLIMNWKWDTNLTVNFDEYLTVSGWNEIKDIASDYKTAFPELIGNSYLPEQFRFSHTNYQRTEASYKAFLEGLFGSYDGFPIDPPDNLNTIIYPNGQCVAYNENIIAQDGPNSETAKFRNSEIFRKLRSDVSTKIGYFPPAFQSLSNNAILNIYHMCRFEKAWNTQKPSTWCSVFTPYQFKILEYEEDLNLYMKTSYGSDITSKVACSAMNDMLNHLVTDASPKFVAYFGHASYILAHMTAMGAFKDTIPLLSNNFDAMADRKFRTSEISPFAANLAVVKYHCTNDVVEKQKVKFFWNQKTLFLNWCDEGGVCKLSDVMDQYSLFRNGDCAEIFCSAAGILFSNWRLHTFVIVALFFTIQFK